MAYKLKIDEDGERVDWESLIREAIEFRYYSVTIDGSRLLLEQNVKIRKDFRKS